jgi:hypothetical protein
MRLPEPPTVLVTISRETEKGDEWALTVVVNNWPRQHRLDGIYRTRAEAWTIAREFIGDLA